MKVEYRVCDRCGDKISHHSRLFATVTIPKVINILWIVTGVINESKRELCGKCADDLQIFMDAKRASAIVPNE